jgi:hypothetical protein
MTRYEKKEEEMEWWLVFLHPAFWAILLKLCSLGSNGGTRLKGPIFALCLPKSVFF